MSPRYRAVLALTLALAAFLPASARVTRPHRPVPSASQLYSRRALRQARIVLQLKLLELREERLERVRKAIEKHLPVDKLLNIP